MFRDEAAALACELESNPYIKPVALEEWSDRGEWCVGVVRRDNREKVCYAFDDEDARWLADIAAGRITDTSWDEAWVVAGEQGEVRALLAQEAKECEA